MNIPSEIIIGGHPYRIVIEDNARFSRSGDKCDWDATIRINSGAGIARSVQVESVLHEIIEVINDMNELKLEHPQITCLSAQLFAVIVCNKLIFFGKEKDEN